MSHHPIILFDGVCTLCNRSIDFVIARDPNDQFRFASLQSEQGRARLHASGLDEDAIDSVVLLEGDKAYLRSTAALRIARRLGSGWPLLYGLIVIPSWIRDPMYDWIARNRYRWFGKREVCRLPGPDDLKRFLQRTN